jgi:hypothetical protein
MDEPHSGTLFEQALEQHPAWIYDTDRGGQVPSRPTRWPAQGKREVLSRVPALLGRRVYGPPVDLLLVLMGEQ